MELSATVKNSFNHHEAVVQTNGNAQAVRIAHKATGYGSAVNGGELLLLALATCFCNDLYREAAKQNLTISEVEVVCTAAFGAEGEPGAHFQYKARVVADAPPEAIEALIRHTDQMAEIHNTLRQGCSVTLSE